MTTKRSDTAPGQRGRIAMLTVALVVALGACVPNTPGTAPVNVAAPSISGTPTVGGTIRATTGAWSGRVTDYRYYWRRCSTGQQFLACTLVQGGASPGYTVTAADAGSHLAVLVSACAANHCGAAEPVTIGPVAAG